jgi:hypothetical protein
MFIVSGINNIYFKEKVGSSTWRKQLFPAFLLLWWPSCVRLNYKKTQLLNGCTAI